MRILLFAIFGSICLAQVSPPAGGGGAPSGPAGGVLSGTYPNPGFTSTAIMPGTLVAGELATLASNTFAGQQVIEYDGRQYMPALLLNGIPYTFLTGGTTTNSWPLFLLQPDGTVSSAWSNTGTMYGVNAQSTFTGNLADLQLNGSSKFSLTYQGNANLAGFIKPALYQTLTNCVNTASPAVCAAAPAGLVQIAAAATTLQINTTAVTANSRFSFTYRTDGITAPTNVASLVQPYVSALTAGSSFTITLPVAPLTNPVNLDFTIEN